MIKNQEYLTSIDQHPTAYNNNSNNNKNQNNIQVIEQTYQQLHKTINEANNRTEYTIKKHESQFLLAYSHHIGKIRKQLFEIKNKSQEQQKMFSSNDRIQYLEKEMAILRQESLKLYDKVNQKIKENDLLRIKLHQLESQNQIQEKQIKQYIKQNKNQYLLKQSMTQKIKQLQNQLQETNIKLQKIKIQNKEQKLHKTKQLYYNESIHSSINTNKKIKQKKLKNEKIYKDVCDYELKEWFWQCIKTIKKQIIQKIKIPSTNIIVSGIEQFRTIDRLKLLSIFIGHQYLLNSMYNLIFHSTVYKLQKQITNVQKVRYNQSEIQSILNDQQIHKEVYQNKKQQKQVKVITGILPKVNNSSLQKKNNTFTLRSARMNISFN